MHLKSSSSLNDCSIFIELDNTVIPGDHTLTDPPHRDQSTIIGQEITTGDIPTDDQPVCNDPPDHTHSNNNSPVTNHTHSAFDLSNSLFSFDDDSFTDFVL